MEERWNAGSKREDQERKEIESSAVLQVGTCWCKIPLLIFPKGKIFPTFKKISLDPQIFSPLLGEMSRSDRGGILLLS